MATEPSGSTPATPAATESQPTGTQVVTDPVTPAAQPAQPAQAQPAAADQNLAMETPIEYETAPGQYQSATIGELVDAHTELQSLGDRQSLKDLAGAMRNEPEALKRVLEGELQKIEQAKPVPADERLAAVEARLQEVESQVGQFAPVKETVEDQTYGVLVKQMLANKEIAKQVPWLAANPDVGVPMAMNYLKRFRDAAKAAGINLLQRRDLIAQAVRNANLHVQGIATGFGGTLPTPESPPAGPAVVVEASANAQGEKGVIPPKVTPADLMRQRMGSVEPTANQNAQPAGVVPGSIPESGGTPGSVPTKPPPAPTGPYNRDALLAHVRKTYHPEGG